MPNSSLLQSACPSTISPNHFFSTAAASRSMDSTTLFLSRIPACIPIACLIPALLLAFVVTTLTFWLSPGGPAWGRFRHSLKCNIGSLPAIPGPRGWPILGSFLDMGRLAHVRLAHLARAHSATSLMAFSLGQSRVVLTCKPSVARELLNSSAFADRPLKQSAKLLLFDRAIGFAPYGDYWRNLRRIAATHLFSPKKIAALEACRQFETSELLQAISDSMSESCVQVRKFLQVASVNNIMNSVFGRRYDFGASCEEAEMLQRMVREGFELLGTFNWGDHLPALQVFDPHRVNERCNKLVEEVRVFVQKIIDEHRRTIKEEARESDFVDIMLSLQNTEKLSDSDIIAVLWEMIFRGTDTTAILMEWILAELVLHPGVQARAHSELDDVVGSSRTVAEADIANLTYLQAIVKETLRLHPPGPLLSWARLAIHDVDIAGYQVPAGTTAMVNMWAITHDADVWEQPDKFMPARFLIQEGGIDLDVRGNDLRLAPFGAGRRVCPGRALGLATVQLWTARLLHHFIWVPAPNHPVDLSEVLKLSCEMKTPLSARAIRRIPLAFH